MQPLFSQKLRLAICRMQPSLTLCGCIRAISFSSDIQTTKLRSFKRKSFFPDYFAYLVLFTTVAEWDCSVFFYQPVQLSERLIMDSIRTNVTLAPKASV